MFSVGFRVCSMCVCSLLLKHAMRQFVWVCAQVKNGASVTISVNKSGVDVLEYVVCVVICHREGWTSENGNRK